MVFPVFLIKFPHFSLLDMYVRLLPLVVRHGNCNIINFQILSSEYE